MKQEFPDLPSCDFSEELALDFLPAPVTLCPNAALAKPPMAVTSGKERKSTQIRISLTEQTLRHFRQEAGGEQSRSTIVKLPQKLKKNKFSNFY